MARPEAIGKNWEEVEGPLHEAQRMVGKMEQVIRDVDEAIAAIRKALERKDRCVESAKEGLAGRGAPAHRVLNSTGRQVPCNLSACTVAAEAGRSRQPSRS